MFDDALLTTLKQTLEQRHAELLERVHRHLAAAGESSARDLSGGVGDLSDEAVAEVAATEQIAGMQSDAVQLADIAAALDRIRAGTYGACLDCGEPIAEERLRVYPTAKRCLNCQDAYERLGRSPTDLTPSL